MILPFLFLLTILLEDARPAAGFPGTGQAAREVVQETVEFRAKKFGLKLAGEAGERFRRAAAGFVARYGDDGVKALRAAGPEAIELAARHGNDAVRICAAHSDDAVRFLASHMDDAMPVWRSFGKAGTELMVKHPGLGKPLLESCGRRGLEIGEKIDTRSVRQFLTLERMVKDPVEKGALIDSVLKEGEKVIEFLWKHKYKLGTGYAFYKLMNDYGSSTGSNVEPGGSVFREASSGARNLAQGFALSTWQTALNHYPWVVLVIASLVLFLLWKIISTLVRVLNWFRGIVPGPRAVGARLSSGSAVI
jgi:hypothetical protein